MGILLALISAKRYTPLVSNCQTAKLTIFTTLALSGEVLTHWHETRQIIIPVSRTAKFGIPLETLEILQCWDLTPAPGTNLANLFVRAVKDNGVIL